MLVIIHSCRVGQISQPLPSDPYSQEQGQLLAQPETKTEVVGCHT